MVVSQLLGGLGNQLFQYAFGRSIALKHGTSLHLDTFAFRSDQIRKYALYHFAIAANELDDSAAEALGISPIGRTLGLARRFLRRGQIPHIRERTFSFDLGMLDAPSTCYLQGYWQSPRYFDHIESRIREELIVSEPLRGMNLGLSIDMHECTSVALHVRRGDYVTDEKTSRYHGTCTKEYYQQAEGILRERVGNFRLFVFSDDPDWAEANLRFQSPTIFLRHNGPERDYEDLRLMTHCNHHIIANSTFSWWGAWLCPNMDKIVIAPRRWFGEVDHSTEDLIPKAWISI